MLLFWLQGRKPDTRNKIFTTHNTESASAPTYHPEPRLCNFSRVRTPAIQTQELAAPLHRQDLGPVPQDNHRNRVRTVGSKDCGDG